MKGEIRRWFLPVCSDQRGITGLETGILLIAFVVVSSVFAFSVLSTDLFSTEKTKKSVNASFSEVRSSLEL